MNDTCIILGLPDYRRLSGVVAAMKARRKSLERHLRRLANELETAELFEAADVPLNVVAIGSTASVRDEATGERFAVRLVFPAELDGSADKASVLSPLGVALIGEEAGTVVTCAAPSGDKRFLIESTSPCGSNP